MNSTLHLFTSIDSTHEYLKRLTSQVSYDHTIRLCLADMQTKGRGQWDRAWHSPAGKNIYLSCLYPIKKECNALNGLSLLVSLAVLKTLKHYATSFFVKWPNDILYVSQDKKPRKISGILVELIARPQITLALISIGLNVNMKTMIHEEMFDWTSLALIREEMTDRYEIGALLVHHLMAYLNKFEREGFSFFKCEYEESHYLKNREIILKHSNRYVSGVVSGVNDQGFLLLKKADQTIEVFLSGEASVVK